jgi:hypothetical protein
MTTLHYYPLPSFTISLPLNHLMILSHLKKAHEIKFYKYYFSGIEKPIIMEAPSRFIADEMLFSLGERTSPVPMERLIDVRVESPVVGVSKTKRFGKTYIWVGCQITDNGWLDEEKFNEISIKSNDDLL